MAQRLIHRPARTRPEPLDLRPVELLSAPTLPDAAAGLQGVMQILMPIMGGAGSLIMIVANRNPVMLIAGGIMLMATIIGAIVMFVAQRTGAGKRANDLRRRYLDYLDRVRVDLAGSVRRQRAVALHHHPDPALLPELVRDPLRLWERRPEDPDFLIARVGTGPSPLWQRVVPPLDRDPLSEPDVVVAAATLRIVERDRIVGGMPIGLPISGRVSIVGPAGASRQVVTTALAQLVAWHGPGELRLFTCVPRRSAGWLDWLKWLPHFLSPDEYDGAAPKRLTTEHPEVMAQLLGPEISRRTGEAVRAGRFGRVNPARFGPAIVVVVDLGGPGGDLFGGLPPEVTPSDLGISVLTLVESTTAEPERVDVRLTCHEEGIRVEDLRPAGDDDNAESRLRAAGARSGTPDVISPSTLKALLRELTAVRLVEETSSSAPLEATLDLGDLVGVRDPGNFDPRATWLPRPLGEFLRVPFGLGPAGERVYLDLKEPALGGMGPHGLCVGATGSGKSEVLRTVVLTLAMLHPPERLSMVLVDYKGGATFAGLEEAPHCAAMISNLSDDTGLVDRLHDALFGEMKRRQQMLADAGNLPNITEYNRRRESGDPACRAPLPNLFVVIDEFGELLTAKPDFIELFLAIGRIGRSIGVHLLLASQRLEEGRLRGLESFLSYRLGLRTFNVGESRAVLGVGDAYELPPIPGSGYLKVDTTVFQRFKAGYVSGAYVPPVTGETVVDAAPVPAPFPFFNDTASYLAAIEPDRPAPVDEPDALAPTVLDVAVRQLAAVGEKVTQIWLPPLPAELTLDRIVGAVTIDPVLGLRAASSVVPVPGTSRHAAPGETEPGRGVAAPGGLTVAIGLLDKPAEQKQEPQLLDLSASGGHLAILGAPQSGKSNLLRTLVVSAALSHQPGEISFYCLDLGGGALRVLDGLPHVAGVAPRLDADRVRRTVAEVAGAMAEREELFGRLGIDSPQAMRAMFRAGRLTELPVADMFLVIDNFPVLRSDFEDLADLVQDLGTRGPGYGIHLILTAGRWSDIRMQLQAAIGNKIEFRLNDPGDSVIGRKQAVNLRADNPGRCLVEGGLQVQTCLPYLSESVAGTGTVETLVAQIAAAWPGESVPPIRMLPTLVEMTPLLAAAGPRSGIVIGVDETDLKPVELDWRSADSHLLVIGDAESGKTSLLKTIIRDLVSKYTDQEVVFAVFDVRRTLLDVVPEDYLGAYAGTTSMAAGMAGGVAGELKGRLPPEDVTAAQLRARSWWRGPEIFVIADDYDLLSPGGAGPLAPFVEFLPQARDVGFHMIVARRSGGAGRSLYEPVPQRLREVGATGLLLSGDRQEGAFYPGVHLSVQPPGRGTLVRRGRKPSLIQLGFRPDDAID
ncbi:S-DNA-T family DNA segregation ATPase FtsK/SpoIIIE [Nakamurella sp. UYEF19]|uniref:type VII secretion protein EccCa n=1 Tax=Nakamurella sp. UYEF19 TaxID=1756392 RepID=UPI003390A254